MRCVGRSSIETPSPEPLTALSDRFSSVRAVLGGEALLRPAAALRASDKHRHVRAQIVEN
jgi:hypothetical protein